MGMHDIFEKSVVYDITHISKELNDVLTQDTYTSILMRERFALVEKYIKDNYTLLDLGCAVGNTIEYFSKIVKLVIGVDFSKRYIEVARNKFSSIDMNVELHCHDITQLHTIESQNIQYGVDCSYSFSTIYIIDNYKKFVNSLHAVTKQGGIAILDLGNSRSINAYCCKFYVEEDGFAPLNGLTINEQIAMLQNAGFTILEHRCFQLLPLWAGKPKWLWPLLHPKWNDIMKRKIRGKMLDEWVSSLPLLRNFAFRHLVVCQKGTGR